MRSFKVYFPKSEILNFAVQLIGSSLQGSEHYGNISDQWILLQIVTKDFIKSLESKFSISLIRDAHLFNGLIAHLRPAIYRIQSDVRMSNPVLNQIKEKHNFVFSKVSQSIKVFEDQFKVTFNEDEISFISMYVSASLERQKQNVKRSPSVIIICV